MTQFAHSTLYRRLTRAEREFERIAESADDVEAARAAGRLSRIRDAIVRLNARERRRIEGRDVFTGVLEGTP